MMSYQQYQVDEASALSASAMAIHAGESERTGFIRRTYTHLAGAVGLFVLIEMAVFTLLHEATLAKTVGAMTRGYMWLVVLGAFMVVSMVANSWAANAKSAGMQYAGLALYIVVEAVIFVPLLYMARRFGDPGTIGSAGLITTVVFAGLTMITFVTRADFGWMGRVLMLLALAFMGAIICGMVFGFHLGTAFSCLGIALAGGYILYYTSEIMHRFRTDQHVVAALCLFAAVALLFWYVLRLIMALQRD